MDVQNIEEKKALNEKFQSLSATVMRKQPDKVQNNFVNNKIVNSQEEPKFTNPVLRNQQYEEDEESISQLQHMRKETITPISKVNAYSDSDDEESINAYNISTTKARHQENIKYNLNENYSKNIQNLKNEMDISDDDEENVSTRDKNGDM
jgi:hypothetical protein